VNLVVGHIWKAGEDVFEVGVWINSQMLAVPDERVNESGFPAALWAAEEQPVFLTDCCWSDGIFGEVIINLNLPVF